MRGLSKALIAAMIAMVAVPAWAQEGPFAGKRIVRVFEEPRHRVVHSDGDLYLLDVQIQPGDTTLPHTHDSPILYTLIHEEDGPSYGETRSDTSYAERPFTHEVLNEGPGLLHLIALLHYGQGKSTTDKSVSVLGDPELEDPWFRSFRVTLKPGEETALVVKSNPLVVIQVTEGAARVTRNDDLVEELTRMGDWVWREANAPFVIKNVGMQPIDLVVNESR